MDSPSQTHVLSPQKALPPLPMTLSPSHSAPNLDVSLLVSRFNTLEVTDADEERSAKQIRRLEAALRRAEMAREEAESEVKGLRSEVRGLVAEVGEYKEVGEDWVVEKERLKKSLLEYEKKYEKAKTHFRAQKVKHEEHARRAAKELLDREKQHWRNQTLLEEEVEWERRLRLDAMDLIAFMEVERQIAVRCAKQEIHASQRQQQKKTKSAAVRADSAVDETMIEEHEASGADPTHEESKEDELYEAEAAIPSDTEQQQREQRQQDEAVAEEDTAMEAYESPAPIQDEPDERSFEQPIEDPDFQIDLQSPTQELSPREPSIERDEAQVADAPADTIPEPEVHHISPPKKQTLTVPINFGDEDDENEHFSDKENSAPMSTLSSSAPAPDSFLTPARSASAFCHRTPNTVSTSTGAGEWNIPGVLAHADLDRAAALAAIRYRRGRARSFASRSGSDRSESRGAVRDGGAAPLTPARKAGAAMQTPKTEGRALAMKRNISTPAGMVGLGTMSVGRKARN